MMYRYLGLETFSDDELNSAFDRIVHPAIDPTGRTNSAATQKHLWQGTDSAVLTEDTVHDFILHRIHDFEQEQQHDNTTQSAATLAIETPTDADEINRQRHDYATIQVKQFLRHFDTAQQQPITKSEFRETMISMAETVDYRKTMPITVSMLMVGTSVGIISPVMPFVVESMGLTTGQYGLVVSAFALAKIAGNVPSAVLVERHGRKPYMVHSLSLIALGTGGIGLAYNFEQLYVCRLLVGIGVAALSSASTMSIADLSNPKNRAQTMAPIMSAFAAGTALGPALGGILADELGIHATFYAVGTSFLAMTAVNQMLLNETKPQHSIQFPWQLPKKASKAKDSSIWTATKIAIGQWAPLLASPQIRNVVVVNGFYWVALAGAQMTLLPLLLTDPNGLAMTATGVGQVYMGMSLVQVLGNPIVAKSVDKLGKVPAMICGCSMIATSMAALPMVTNDLTSVALTLGIWSAGSTLLSTAPVAHISDHTDDNNRAQAIALLRTSGDIGFLVGASAVGALADWTGGLDVAMQSSAAVLLTATAWFGVRQYYTNAVNLAMSATREQHDETKEKDDHDDQQVPPKGKS